MKSTLLLKLFFVVMLLTCTTTLRAQIEGPSSAYTSVPYVYSYNAGYTVTGPYWTVNGIGTVQDSWDDGNTYWVSIIWTSTGTGTVRMFSSQEGALTSYYYVSVSACDIGAPSAVSSSFKRCGPGALTLQASPGSSATTVNWYTTSSGGNLLATGTSYTTPYQSSNTTYYFTSYNSSTGCESTPRSSMTTTIGAIPEAWNLVMTGASICGSGQVTISGTTGVLEETVMWYDAATGGSSLGSGTLYNTPTLSSTTMYYGSVYNTTTECESTSRAGVQVVVKPKPVVTVSGIQTLCSGESTAITLDSDVSGTSYSYTATPSNVTGTTSESGITNTSFNRTLSSTSGNSPGTMSYFFSGTADGCQGTATNGVVNVNPVPTLSVNNSLPSLCSGQQLTNIILSNPNGVSGKLYSWSISPANVTGASSASNTTTSTISQLLTSQSGTSQGTVNYSVTASYTASGRTCTSSPGNTIVTVKPVPQATVTSSQTLFVGSSTSITVTSTIAGSSFSYGTSANTNVSNAVAGSIVPIAQALTLSNNASPGTVTYTITPSLSGCSGTAKTSVVSLYPFPVVTSNIPYVYRGSQATLSAQNLYDSYIWQSVSIGTQPGTSTRSVSRPEDYRVQVTKNGVSSYSGYFRLGSQFYNVNENYVVSNSMLTAITDTARVNLLPADSVSQTVQYLDGLGRPLQSVTTQGSPNKNDIVQPMVYDAYGREIRTYLPFVAGADGAFKSGVIDASGNFAGAALNFYNNGTTDNIVDDARYFSEKQFESAPTNRLLKEYGPGQNWYTNDKPVRLYYLLNYHGTNPGQEKIISWTVNASNLPVRMAAVAGYIFTGGYYASGQLSISSTKDEQGREVREYTDKLGHVVLKKVQYVDSPTLSNKDHWAQTYYVYDDLGNLRFVLPPELTKIIYQNDTYNPTTTDLNNWAFQYNYDNRKRMIEKQVPGANPVYMVYDNRDRLVLTQDGVQRSLSTKYWSFTKYDELNRPIMTGIKDTAASLTQAQMQAAVNSHFAKASSRFSETYVGSAAGNLHGYSNRAYPARTGLSTEVDPNKYLSVTYYDDYSYKTIIYDSASYSFITNDLTGDPNPNNNQKTNYFKRLSGKVTGTKVKVLDGGVTGGYTWLKTVNYYDDKGRMIQVISDNYKGGTDRTTSSFDFAGKVMKTKSTHVEKDVTWKDRVNVSIAGNKVVALAVGWGSSGAASVQQLGAGQNGWVEVTTSEVVNTHRMIGLSDTNPNASYETIKYAIYQSNVQIQIFESGVQKAILSAPIPGEVLRVERTGTVVQYKRNGAVVYTSATPSSTSLMVDAALYSLNTTLIGARTSFGNTTHSTTRRFDYDHAGRLLKIYHKFDTESEKLLVQNEYNALGQLVDKKLYSTNGTNFKQSQDYRYNIRGWLTKINESDVNNNQAGDPRDLFGMELLYDQVDAGIANSASFNGNISAMKWSKDQSFGTKKENAYAYGYDPLSRITGATFKEKTSSWALAANNGFSESGYTYDQNGNIKSLIRYDQRGSTSALDNLTYNYGAGADFSNKLRAITDTGDDFGGFKEGTNTGFDYVYDVNGNMTLDEYKNASVAYNYLNLPQTVTHSGGGNKLDYIYDATGRKLAQVASFGGSQKQTDYAGEYQYENDVLQFVGHEEGRIVISSTQTVYYDDATVTANFTASNTTLSTVTQNASQKYVKAVSNGTTVRSGMFPIGGTIPVVAGELYKIRVKGYRDKGTAASSSPAYLLIKAGGTDLNWPGASLPVTVATALAETWIEQIITIPTGATTLEAGVVWNTVLAGEGIFINDFEISKLTTNLTPEYQFNLKDHLGNVRVSFTTKTDVEITAGTLETANTTVEQSQYLRYANAKRVNAAIFDRTNGASAGYSERLNGSANEKYGLARSLSVMPGDSIKLEVYAKYIDPNSANWTGALNTLVSQIAANTAGVVVDGSAYGSSTSSFPAGYGAAVSKTDNGAPKAYLNWLIFDRNFGFITGGFKQITTAAKEAGSDVAHEKIAPASPIVITQPGYVYVYLSNEETTYTREVYFDDLKVSQIKSPVLQMDDYYPFGLTFNSYTRENSIENRYLYNQGKGEKTFKTERIFDLGLAVDLSQDRTYDYITGRWWQIDPKADKGGQESWSPNHFSFNNPIRYNDPKGDCPPGVNCNNPLPTMQVRHNRASNIGPGYVRNSGTRFHAGHDLHAPTGTNVSSALAGKVVSATNTGNNSYGNTVVVKSNVHPEAQPGFMGPRQDPGAPATGVPEKNLYVQYSHLETMNVATGATVTSGQSVGTVGTTGNAQGMTGGDVHLHINVGTGVSASGTTIPNNATVSPNTVYNNVSFTSANPAGNQSTTGVVQTTTNAQGVQTTTTLQPTQQTQQNNNANGTPIRQ